MRRLWIALTTGGAALAVPAFAEDKPAPAIDGSAGVTVTSDYRFRGISQSNKRPALQGTVGLTHASGFYVGTWASTISNYVASGSDAEIDLYAGYKTTTAGGTTVDAGVLYYLYPGSTAATTNFFEPYANISHAFGAVTTKVGANFAWKQKALSTGTGNRSGFYVYGELGAAIPKTPVTITGHLGRSLTANYITFGTQYTDWSLTAAVAHGPATFSVGYFDTNTSLFSYPTGGGRNRKISNGGVAASVGFAF